jgi:integrase
MSARRGWRERVEPGVYRVHRLACTSSQDEKSGRRCGCPYSVKVPGHAPGTTRMVKVEGSISEARAERRRLMAEGRPKVVVAVEPSTLDEFAAHYLRARSAVLSSAAIYSTEESYRLRVSPTFGSMLLTEITRERLEAWMADLVATATSRRMVTKSVEAIRVILAAAVEWGRIPSNPAMRLRLPPSETHTEQKAERVLTLEQLRHLAAEGATDRRQETLIRVAGEAGLRRGELIGLRWPDVDLAARRIHVRRSVWQERSGPRKGEKVEKSTKGRRRRAVAVSADLARLLADFYAESVVERGRPAEGLVWPGRDGDHMAADTPTQIIERAQDRCGLVENPKPRPKGERPRPLVTLHGLRHTAGSIALAAGVPLIVVSRQLGHSNPQITATVYAHLLSDSQLDDVAAVFDPVPALQALSLPRSA